MIRSKKITNAARDQDCTLNILGVCNFDPATVVFCHFPYESHVTSARYLSDFERTAEWFYGL